MNFSAGLIAGRGPVEVTADWFRIDVEDRVALTQEIRLGPDEIDVLLSEGILEAMNFPVFRFFVNDFSTRTEGLDVLASWRVSDRTSVRASWNYTVTLVGALGSNVIDDFRVQTLERGLPLVRWQFSAAHERAAWRMNGRVSWYGAYWDSEDGRNAAALGAYQPVAKVDRSEST